MAMSGFICHDDYLEKTSRLSDTEIGRVFRALMKYHATKQEPVLNVVESMAFDFIRVDIDRTEKEYQKKCDKNREIRLAAIENERNRTLTIVDERDKEKKRKRIEKENEKEKEPLLNADDAQAIQSDHNRVLDAAEDAGFKMSNDVRAALIALYADNGLNKMLDALISCVDHGAPNLAYLKAVLKGESKKKVVAAQKFTQRDYDEVQDEAYRRMIKEIVS